MQTTLLYVRSPRRLHEGEREEPSVLDPSQIPYDECEDIYRALARLCRPDGASIDTVLVALDGLLSDEFEFFALARRYRPDVTTYVHARNDPRNRIALAIERGAAGELTEEVLSRLRGRCSSSDEPIPGHPHDDDPTPQDQQPATLGQNTEPDQPQGALADQETLDLAGAPNHEESAPPDAADQECSAPVRVPWLSRENAPRRIRPAAGSWTHGANDEPDDEPAAKATTPDALSEPLLTQEELAALISDEPDSAPPTEVRRSSDSEASS